MKSKTQGTRVRGYKAFNSDWTCRGKQYACPGKFEEEGPLEICHHGMHFCRKAVDCFNYHAFVPETKVAEVIAYGKIEEKGDKCCTDKLEIVREIPWYELLDMVNTGKGCTGFKNTGNRNSGSWNTGHFNTGSCNTGDWNSGSDNRGHWNSGEKNAGNHNTGHCNIGHYNTGDCNTGALNTGKRNSGSRNVGKYNDGSWNSGSWNSGDWNSGDWNSGDWNSGDWNSGDWNSGDWNSGDFNSGCFNTDEPKIRMFNRPSDWTRRDWLESRARFVLDRMPTSELIYVEFVDMTDEEKEEHPEAETTDSYLRKVNNSNNRAEWWKALSEEDKNAITSLPNFDPEIFAEISGIDVNNG